MFLQLLTHGCGFTFCDGIGILPMRVCMCVYEVRLLATIYHLTHGCGFIFL